MRKSSAGRRVRRVGLTLAAAAVAIGCAVSVNAQVLNFTSRGGFYSGSVVNGGVEPATILKGATGGAPESGFGGLEFYTTAPDSPLVGETWKALAWGCLNPSDGNCANGGSSTTPWFTSDPGFDPNADGRSSLEVIGCPNIDLAEPKRHCPANTLDTVNWTPITKVIHHNHVIGPGSNVLSTVDISSFLRVGTPLVAIDGPAGSITSVVFTETRNFPGQSPTNCASPGGVLLANPVGNTIGSQCDDFAFVSGLDLSPLFIPQGVVGNPTALQVNFRMTSPGLNPGLPDGALVCGAPPGQAPNPNPLCNGFTGPPIVIYTAERGNNSFQVEAQLSPFITVALFVIGDCEAPGKLKKGEVPPPDNNLREIGDEVNFWGSQWWKNNCMSVFTDNGYPAFKGYATNVAIGSGQNCGQWEARPGNSGNPPDTLPDVINIIVTDNVMKDGPNISGNIKQVVTVDRTLSGNDRYAGNPGHQGWGKITGYLCGPVPAQGAR